jgi:choline dehydrogenase-like flavoprotein
VPPSNYSVPEESSYTTRLAILMNPQSRGSATLRSAYPKDAPLIDPKYLDHPFDRKVMLELVRETVKFQQESTVGKYFKRYIIRPKSTSGEDILVRLHAPDSVDLDHTDQVFVSFSQEFINEATSPLWHANGTIKMGPLSDPTACINNKFCVYGIESLRVADMSVAR